MRERAGRKLKGGNRLTMHLERVGTQTTMMYFQSENIVTIPNSLALCVERKQASSLASDCKSGF